MDVFTCIHTRRSIRKFKNRPVEWYLIGKILDAGSQAPTAGNLQDFRFMVVTNPALKKELADASLQQLWIAQAPYIIVVFAEFIKTKRLYGIRGERLYVIQDCAAAAQNMLLAAHAQGLGACWVGAFDEDRIRAALGIPDYARPQAIIPVGYPDEEVPAPGKYKLEHLVFFNRWADNSGKVMNPETEIFKDWAPHVMKAVDKTRSAVQGSGEAIGNKITAKAKELAHSIKEKLSKRKD